MSPGWFRLTLETVRRALLVFNVAVVGALGCGGDGGNDAAPTRTEETRTEVARPAGKFRIEKVSPPGSDRWPSAWCELSVGMTRDEAIAVMGPATGRGSESKEGHGVLRRFITWTDDVRGNSFRADLTPNGRRVTRLVIEARAEPVNCW